MFEGFVSQVLLGYLGRYVKGIQKDQLKIGLWREEILLEKVELILEAFDYLQLPFALKTGQVGKLSIKVPWKKLGWEPIIVALEDVFICSCHREDNEWSSESVERRELAGKMAKLNAIELAKFSRRVSDNPAGQSFLSYIYAKILDNIQVSIKNVHIVYMDSHNTKGNFIFGLRFSTLTIMTDTQKQSDAMSTLGKSSGGQVNKSVEISNIGLYCNLLEGNPNPLDINETTGSQLCCYVNIEPERYDYLVKPFDVSISLLVNKTGKVDGGLQYAIIAELTTLVLSLNEIQLEQILILWDYFSICSLREKYGRYRPPQNSLSQKLNGWQIMWWHYAQESVLADVRHKLRKTSWSNFGIRIGRRRRYVNLYKRKLELLQQQQLVNKDILTELEKMDKECDIDDILNFRCVAEQELQDFLNSNSPNMITNDLIHSQEKLQIPDQVANNDRGWLNWLSLGMLGAGGTADSNSFAGVVSDEIIKDIYDATEFHPLPSSGGDSLKRDKFCSFSIKLNIYQIILTISTGRLNRNIANAILDGINVESKVWEDSVAVLASIGSVKIVSPCDDIIVLMSKKAVDEESSPVNTLPFVGIQINMPQPNQHSELSVKVMLHPFEVTYEPDFFRDMFHYFDACEPTPNDSVSSLSFSPKANHLVATSWDNQVRCWEIGGSSSQSKTAISHDQPVLCSTWKDDGPTVFTGGCDKIVKMWPLLSVANLPKWRLMMPLSKKLHGSNSLIALLPGAGIRRSEDIMMLGEGSNDPKDIMSEVSKIHQAIQKHKIWDGAYSLLQSSGTIGQHLCAELTIIRLLTKSTMEAGECCNNK